MTTIVMKDGVIAADTQITQGKVKMTLPSKIHQLTNGSVLVGAGTWANVLNAVRFYSKTNWQAKLDDIPEGLKDIEALLVLPDGGVYYVDGSNVPYLVTDNFIAIGTGWQFALAAMECGKSAVDAVKVASKYDIYTNDQVTTYNVPKLQEAGTSKGRSKPRVSPSKEGTGRGAKKAGGEGAG